jgi:hypothetical protein
MVRRFLFLAALATALTGGVIAMVFGSVRGVVHDPQHRPMSGAHVTIQANNSAYKQEADTNADGVFEFQAVLLGQYTVTVEAPVLWTSRKPCWWFRVAHRGCTMRWRWRRRRRK